MKEETYKDIFNNQWGTGKFWVDLHKHGNFDIEKFFMYEDVSYLCKKAQADAYQNMIEKFKDSPYRKIILDIELEIEKLWK